MMRPDYGLDDYLLQKRAEHRLRPPSEDLAHWLARDYIDRFDLIDLPDELARKIKNAVMADKWRPNINLDRWENPKA